MRHQRLSKRFDTFIFDWDGTLTTGLLLRKLNELFNPFWKSRKRSSARRIDRYAVAPKGRHIIRGSEVRRHIIEKEVEHPLVTALVDASVYFFKPKLQMGAREVLRSLSENGSTVALFTNGAQYRVLKEVAHLKVERYFSVMVSAQSIKALKPNPLGLNMIIKSLNARKDRTLYLGDMVDDMETAKYAGVHSCAITNGFHDYATLKATKPDYVFRNLEEFYRAL